MMSVAIFPVTTVRRWGRARHAAYRSVEALPRKDFSALPVCGGLRPSASQRELAKRRSAPED